MVGLSFIPSDNIQPRKSDEKYKLKNTALQVINNLHKGSQ
jgi:hypothetical protein